MHIWIITIGEPLPWDYPGARLLRSALFAHHLSALGHRVTFWTSSFDHSGKRHRSALPVERRSWDGIDVVMLHGCGYQRNLSLARVRDHHQVAELFRSELSSVSELPNRIVASHPTAELCDAALSWAKPRAIPVLVDVRDHWPDAFAEVVPRPLRPMARLCLGPARRRTGRILAGATGLIGITRSSLDWALALAGRPQGSCDAVVPLTGQPLPEQDAATEKAETYWRSQGIDPERELVAMFVGTIGRWFEFEALIAAARRLEGYSVRPIRLVLCGDGDLRARYQALAGDLPRVVWPGWVDQPAIAALGRLAHVGLAPYAETASFDGALPNKVIEYFSLGLPILSSLRGEAADLLAAEACGASYRADDVAGLSALLASYAADPARCAAEGARSRRLHAARFSPSAVFGAYTDLVLRTANRNNP